MDHIKKLKTAFLFTLIVSFSAISGFYAGSVFQEPEDNKAVYADTRHVTNISDDSFSGHNVSALDFRRAQRPSNSGNFLIGIIAQKRHDWRTASHYFERLLDKDPDNIALKRRTMVLFLGSNQLDRAARIAYELKRNNVFDAMASVILVLEAVKNERFDEALNVIENMSDSHDSKVVRPLLTAWVKAALGELDVDNLLANPLYIYDAVSVASYLDRKDGSQEIIQKALNQNGIVSYDLERIGDLLAQRDLNEKALTFYKAARKQQGKNISRLTTKIAALKQAVSIDPDDFIVEPPATAAQGLARSLFDISMVLFRQGADEPARLYACMAIALDTDFTDARFLLGHIMTHEGQLDEAFRQYTAISQNDKGYLKAQRQAANILEQAEYYEDAIAILENLEKSYGDVKSRIEIGNVYRGQEKYKAALKSYNKAFKRIGENDRDKWNLYYLRGMTHERLGQFDDAVADLNKALELQPDNAYILNYLGYSLADKGRELDRALKLIRKAAALEPNDGYITDSLGWVLYRLGEYEQAVPHLERAVELLPYDAIINDHLGDAYWQVGRELEARFQWRRALNHSEDEELSVEINKKMDMGLDRYNAIQAAQNDTGADVE